MRQSYLTDLSGITMIFITMKVTKDSSCNKTDSILTKLNNSMENKGLTPTRITDQKTDSSV